MSQESNIAIAQSLLGAINRQDSAEVSRLCAPDLEFEIQGDEGALPWIGRYRGRQALVDFMQGIRHLTESIRFDVDDILASDSRAAVVGSLATRVKSTGRVTATQFAIILTIQESSVVRFQMLEDSFDVSRAARA